MGCGEKVSGSDGGSVPKRASSCVDVWYAIMWCETARVRDSEIGREAKSLAQEGPIPPSVSMAAGIKK